MDEGIYMYHGKMSTVYPIPFAFTSHVTCQFEKCVYESCILHPRYRFHMLDQLGSSWDILIRLVL